MKSVVYLNVYDILATKNNFISQFGFGLYHTGVEVYGREYSFAGGEHFKSGIYAIEPKQAMQTGKLRLHKSIEIGKTHLTQAQVSTLIDKLGNEFRTNDYCVVNKNCNHFCDRLCEELCDEHIPKWINRTAKASSRLPLSDQVAGYFYKKALKKHLERKASGGTVNAKTL